MRKSKVDNYILPDNKQFKYKHKNEFYQQICSKKCGACLKKINFRRSVI